MTDSIVVYQHHKCINTTNGNPRRLWVFYEIEVGANIKSFYSISTPRAESPYATISAVWDEGYVGWPHGIGPRSDYAELPSVNITPTEYRHFIESSNFKG